METYIPHLIAFIVLTVIILLTVVLLGAVSETSTIDRTYIPITNYTSVTITPATDHDTLFSADGTCSSGGVDGNVYRSSPPWIYHNGTHTFNYMFACLHDLHHGGDRRNYQFRYGTNSAPTYAAECLEPRSGFALDFTPAGRGDGATGDGGYYTLQLVKRLSVSDIQDFQCGGVYPDAWGDVMQAYDDGADSAYDMLVIMVIIGVAGLILLLMKIEF